MSAKLLSRFTTNRTIQLRPRKACFSTSAAKPKTLGRNFGIVLGLAAVAIGGGGYCYYQQRIVYIHLEIKPLDYQQVYDAIASKLNDNDYDDGSYGPLLVRLAWHAAGTYDKNTKTGGSNGATMRFNPESAHGANAGLSIARDLLEPIKKQFPKISYSDLWSLAGVVAIQEMGGPTIKWRPGRTDAISAESCTPDGRLPDASKAQDHLRDIFYRMGFNDQEIVALSGAHADERWIEKVFS
jgi:cytochrome c peroxidase